MYDNVCGRLSITRDFPAQDFDPTGAYRLS